ncbi:MAG: hypothetical protein IAC51_01835 [bacterium]|uniref:Uncharacterized protein n=1 Tax=Candidatus Aphodosoma intestinipullorum TaxID=2840674 RepID=A0A940DJ14_9BACT|nr:hypothetical protein [Candidatus Aphodosoma intestinipullorum]
MNTNEILEILRQSLSNRRIDLPRDMDFSLSCGTLDILMTAEGLLSNMQENASAFESWALCIKAALPQIDRVTVGWNAPARPDTHYNRFVYRAVRFEENYSWVTLRIPDDSITAAALADIDSNTLILNHPVVDAKALASDSSSEAARERDLLSLMVGRHPDSIVGQQLPTGLKKLPDGAEWSPCHGSAIDLWMLEQDTLRIFELKKGDNRPIGIISQLMFYANIMADLISGRISCPAEAASAPRSADRLYARLAEKGIKRLEAIFLSDTMHTLCSAQEERVLSLLNENSRNILYRRHGTDTI